MTTKWGEGWEKLFAGLPGGLAQAVTLESMDEATFASSRLLAHVNLCR